MDDIIKQLTAFHGLPRCTTPGCVTCDAAAEIEQLRTELNNQAFITETLHNHQPH